MLPQATLSLLLHRHPRQLPPPPSHPRRLPARALQHQTCLGRSALLDPTLAHETTEDHLAQRAGNHISGLDTDELCMGLVKFPTHTPHFLFCGIL